MSKGKKFKSSIKKVEFGKQYSANSGIQKVQEIAYASFDETMEAHFNLNIDPRHADQQLRGTLNLPNGTGQQLRVVAIVDADSVAEAKDAGADEVGGKEIIEKIQGGWFEFDVIIATPSMMPHIGKLGRALGAKGLMPNPKSGTVTTNVGKTVKEFKGGKIEYRSDKNGIVHVIFGKKSFDAKKLEENFVCIYDTILKVKPAKVKGAYIKSISMSSTMSPGVFIEPSKIKWLDSQV